MKPRGSFGIEWVKLVEAGVRLHSQQRAVPYIDKDETHPAMATTAACTDRPATVSTVKANGG